MFNIFTEIFLQNIGPVPWNAYLPFIFGIIGFVLVFSIVVLIISWWKKRKVVEKNEGEKNQVNFSN